MPNLFSSYFEHVACLVVPVFRAQEEPRLRFYGSVQVLQGFVQMIGEYFWRAMPAIPYAVGKFYQYFRYLCCKPNARVLEHGSHRSWCLKQVISV